MDPQIFSTYDIRGIYQQQWNQNDAYRIGQALGTFLAQNGIGDVYLGQDNRPSSPEIAQFMTKGLLSTGQNVTDLGMVITPMIYFSWYQYQAPATAMITASHNPTEYNGLKSAMKREIICDDQLQAIRQIIEKNNFFTRREPGQKTSQSISDSYINRLVKDINIKKPLKIIIDTGNGTAGLFARKLFEKTNCQAEIIFEESDGTFPNHPAYPQKEEFYKEIKTRLSKGGFDLGLAFDGDGDRIGIYTPEGNFIQNDVTAGILAQDIARKHPGQKIVLNISTTMAVLESIEAAGGKPILWKTGFPLIRKKMTEEKAIFGGEISGHFFFADRYYGYDDAFYASLRLLEIISQQGKSINQLANQLPQYYQIPESRLELPKGANKYQLVEAISADIKAQYPEAKIMDIDGIRFSFEHSWGLIRPSNTEPLLSTRAEGKSPKELEKVKAIINRQLEKHHFNQRI